MSPHKQLLPNYLERGALLQSLVDIHKLVGAKQHLAILPARRAHRSSRRRLAASPGAIPCQQLRCRFPLRQLSRAAKESAVEPSILPRIVGRTLLGCQCGDGSRLSAPARTDCSAGTAPAARPSNRSACRRCRSDRRRQRGSGNPPARSGSSSGKACGAGYPARESPGRPARDRAYRLSASRLSRIASASSRCRFMWPNSRLSGSAL